MVEGQAFNGIKKAHWDCAPGTQSRAKLVAQMIHEAPIQTIQNENTQRDLTPRPPARPYEKGPTSADVRIAAQDPQARQTEKRKWAEVWRRPVNGKTSIGLECPFCFEVVQSFVWSLPNGKRCTCGALHGRQHSSHWHHPTQPAS
jgi:hypothetical protein